MKIAVPMLALLLAAGCAFPNKEKTHYTVIGFGVVSVNATNRTGANVIRVKSVGLTVSDSPGTKFAVGYLNETTTEIPTNSNVIIEVK